MIIERLEPASWWVGMKISHLQILLYGKGIRDAEVTTDYPGARVEDLARLDSSNYLFVYLDLKDAEPGTMFMDVRLGNSHQTICYPLLKRDKSGEDRQGFTNADVLYLLMPDRFAKGNSGTLELWNSGTSKSRHGGNLAGIEEHLDYFTRLGVTALWLTPVLENTENSYHGYATTNYYRIDPRFGSNEEYKHLVDACHQKGLKVVMDMIFNHCAIDHPWVKNPPSEDWFNPFQQTSYRLTPAVDPYASDIDRQELYDGWFVPTMPDLNQRNPHLIRYLIQTSKWWIETVGIDGIRMDTFPYADPSAMSQWLDEMKLEYPNFNIVGETWVNNPAFTATLQNSLPTVMDFSFQENIQYAAKWEETNEWWEGYNRIYNSLVYDYLYARPDNVLAFLDNHDTDRFLERKQDPASLVQGLAILLTMNRIPQIYYGTEILMTGSKKHGDSNVRKDFPGGFPGSRKNAFTGTFLTHAEKEMQQWLSRLLHWRQGNEVISKGRQVNFIPWKGTYVLARQYQGKTVMTIVNGLNKPNQVDITRYKELYGTHTEAQDVMSADKVSLTTPFQLPARGTMIIEF